MKNTYSLLTLAAFFLVCCGQRNNLINTKWENQVGNCSSSISFKTDMNYEYFDCELQETFTGKYENHGKLITLEQMASEYDGEFESDSRHKSKTEKYKLIVNDNLISFVEVWDSKSNEWKKLPKELNTYTLIEN